MTKHLIRSGNSLALVLDKPLLKATGIDQATPLEISTDGDVIVISPLREGRRDEELRRAAEDMHRRFGGAFARLARE